ncbi:MAG: hypothetical protein IJ815_05015 [Lachnospiraceae bacterium]|nr:hypothetical protein [Lachnospiraceae bacterium]
MAENNTAYQCPNCTGPLQFNAKIGKMKCDFCLSEFDVEEIKSKYAEKNMKAEGQEAQEFDWGDGSEKIRGYSCSTCGAELICEETTAATSCPYCGNPTVIPAKFGGADKPDYCIPFKVEKKKAIAALKEYYKGKLLLPGSFVASNHLEEINGVYVPFWFYSGTSEGSATFDAVKESRHRSGKYEIVTEKHYDVYREGSLHFDKIPVDASKKMADDLMDSIEPYNYEELKKFELEYLPGYLANKYDETKEQCMDRAKKRANESLVEALRNSVKGYDSVDRKSDSARFVGDKIEYGVLPVWMLTTKWDGKGFTFAMNGQTGRMIGNLPISIPKAIAWFIGVFLAAGALTNLIFDDLTGAAISGIVVAAIVLFALVASMKPVAQAKSADRYVDDGGLELAAKTDKFSHTTERRNVVESNSK